MSAIGKAGTGNKYDYEIKQIKEVFNQQLNKAKEECAKYKQQFKETEAKLKAYEEDNRKRL